MVKKTLLKALMLSALIGLTHETHARPQIEVHGNVRFDAQWNNRYTIIFPAVPFGEPSVLIQPDGNQHKNRHKQTLWDARLSQLRVQAWDCYYGVQAKGEVEIDFLNQTIFLTPPAAPLSTAPANPPVALINGDARSLNGYAPRLRLGYVRLEGSSNWFMVAGQDWSKFGTLAIASPKLVDYQKGPAVAGLPRNPQLAVGYHYYMPQNLGHLVFVTSVERQAFGRNSLDFLFNPSPANRTEGDGHLGVVPVCIAKTGWLGFKPFQFEISAAFTENRIVRNRDFLLYKTQAWGYNAVAQTEFKTVQLYAGYRYLDGLNHLSGLPFPDVVFQNLNDVISPIPIPPSGPKKLVNVVTKAYFVGAGWDITPYASLAAVWGKRWSPAIPFSTLGPNLPQIRTFDCIQVAYLQKFLNQFQFGIQYKRFFVRNYSPQSANYNAIATALWYYF